MGNIDHEKLLKKPRISQQGANFVILCKIYPTLLEKNIFNHLLSRSPQVETCLILKFIPNSWALWALYFFWFDLANGWISAV